MDYKLTKILIVLIVLINICLAQTGCGDGIVNGT
jgi:hypothetical protein